ncbi:hypothetical protein [Streptomyces sp. NPDC048269]|uniref:hypothetical protein n=1 Tax=Streptomyces sp. NPDC048269 TaxID=3155753 RepID=UPI00344AE756
MPKSDAGQVARAAREISDLIHTSPDGSVPEDAITTLLGQYPHHIIRAAIGRIDGANIKITNAWE